MANEKQLNTRLLQKHDIEANWVKATGFTPKEGEIIVYDADASHLYPRIKIGNGKDNVNTLKFTQSQGDWNQNDEAEVDYIKNKPDIATDEEIIELLMKEDMFPVVTDSDGSILSTEGNIILW